MNPPSNDYLPGSRPAIYYHRTTGYDNSLHGLSMPLDRNQIIDVWSQRCGNTEINCAGDIDLRGVNWVLPRYMPDFFSCVFLLQPTCGMNVVREGPYANVRITAWQVGPKASRGGMPHMCSPKSVILCFSYSLRLPLCLSMHPAWGAATLVCPTTVMASDGLSESYCSF